MKPQALKQKQSQTNRERLFMTVYAIGTFVQPNILPLTAGDLKLHISLSTFLLNKRAFNVNLYLEVLGLH